jgi:hypothetical protein
MCLAYSFIYFFTFRGIAKTGEKTKNHSNKNVIFLYDLRTFAIISR